MCRRFEICQQSYLFEHRKRQILCFVDDQNGRFARLVTVHEPLVQFHQLLALGCGGARDFKLGQHKVKKLARVHPRIENKRRLCPLRIQPIQKTVDERRLACSNFARKGQYPLPGLDAIHQTRQSLFDLLRDKHVTGIWTYVERVFLQAEEAFVHGSLNSHDSAMSRIQGRTRASCFLLTGELKVCYAIESSGTTVVSCSSWRPRLHWSPEPMPDIQLKSKQYGPATDSGPPPRPSYQSPEGCSYLKSAGFLHTRNLRPPSRRASAACLHWRLLDRMSPH